ncbi:hypothetical protein [Saliniramus sp.]|uniref:hypothetical protein n=1 Tax=Saliniramus sp. TaxID=2986772 RepID=UPI002BA12D31|nr:hypothetical protein [Saliniramus sp.]HMB12262.1 hypothetical protein [Saliniramus sp.]
MDDYLTRRVAAHRDYLDDMLRSLGYAMTDLDGTPALPVVCGDCGQGRDCAGWLDTRVADMTLRRSGAADCADVPASVWPRFCPNCKELHERLRAAN